MKDKKLKKSYCEARRIRQARQVVMNNVLQAISLAKQKQEHTFFIDGCIVTSTYKDLWDINYLTNAYAIIRMKRGYGLGYVISKGKPHADLECSHVADVTKNGQIKIWLRKVEYTKETFNRLVKEGKEHFYKMRDYFKATNQKIPDSYQIYKEPTKDICSNSYRCSPISDEILEKCPDYFK